MATITSDQRRLIELAEGEPVRLEDEATHRQYVLISAEEFDTMRRLLAPILEPKDGGPAADSYRAADEAFREGWEAPGMSDYDDYESRRP